MKIYKSVSLFLVIAIFILSTSPLFVTHSQEDIVTEETFYCEDPNAHVVGDMCYCNDGYAPYNGTCKTLNSICKSMDSNAFYNAALGDCDCPSGFTRDDANSKCIPQQAPTATNLPQATSAPIKTVVPTIKVEASSTLIPTQPEKEAPKATVLEQKEETRILSSNNPEDTIEILRIQEDKIISIPPSLPKDMYSEFDSEVEIPKISLTNIVDKIDINPEEKMDVKIQIDTIQLVFNDSPSKEFTYSETLEGLTEDIMPIEDAIYRANREEKIKTKLEKKEFKSEQSQNAYNKILDQEKKLAEEIVAKTKLMGMYHRRLMEVKGPKSGDNIVNVLISYDMQDKEYKELFPVSVEKQFGGDDGLAFEGISNAIISMGNEVKETKEQIKKKKEERINFENSEFDIETKPTQKDVRESVRKLFFK